MASLLGSIEQPVLALDHAFNILSVPSLLDAGERSVLLRALRPCERLRAKLAAFTSRISTPWLAAHVRRSPDLAMRTGWNVPSECWFRVIEWWICWGQWILWSNR